MPSIEWTLELRFVVALGLGFLIGLERESSGADRKSGRVFAGVRTYTVISLYGFACAWLYRIGVVWAMPAGMISLTALVVAGYLAKSREGRVGWTSEISALLTFAVGVLALLTDVWVPITLGVINTLLLSEKGDLERFVDRLNTSEFLAVLKFLVVTAIILPALPDQSYTRFNINPVHVWRIVILVSSIGFVGYFLTKKFGSRIGLWLSGILGGIVSSTAVSIAAGRMAQRNPAVSFNALQMSLLASSVMYLRILALIFFLNPSAGMELWWHCIILACVGVLLALRLTKHHGDTEEKPASTLENPFELKPALIFALVFIAISVVSVYARETFGQTGIIVLALIVGVADIDPFILSIISGHGMQAVVIFPVLLAMMSNTFAKGMYFAFLVKDLRMQAAWRYGLWAVLHLPLLFL
jgi:uncharacterized membrane protein (DUF4010 family)